MIVNPDGSVIVSADPRGPMIADINDYLYGPWIASIMQRAQGGGGGALGPSPWDQKIPAQKQTQKGSGQGGTQQTRQTQQAPNVDQGVRQMQQDIAQAALQLLPNVDQGVRQMQQAIGQAVPQAAPAQPISWFDRFVFSPPYDPAGFVAKLYQKIQQSLNPLQTSPPTRSSLPVVQDPLIEVMADTRLPTRTSPPSIETAPQSKQPLNLWKPYLLGGEAGANASILYNLLQNVFNSSETPSDNTEQETSAGIYPEYTFDWGPFSLAAAGAGASGGALYNAYKSQGKNAPPLPTPIEDSVAKAMAQTPAVNKSLKELHGDIDWAKVAAGDPAERIKAENWRNRFGWERSIYDAADQTPLKELHGNIDWAKVALGDPAESIKAENWRNRFGWERSIYNVADQQPLNELYGNIDWAKVAAGDPVESIKAENWRTRFELEKAIYDAADQQSLKELHGNIDWAKAAAGDPTERIKAENWRNRFGWEESVYNRELSQAARPQAASSLSQLVGRNLKTFGSQLKGNAKIMAPIGLGLVGLSKLLEGSPAEAAVQPNPSQIQTGQPNLSGLSDWGQVLYSTLPDQEKARIAAMSPAQQASWEKTETIKREGLQDAWNPLESLLYAPMAAGGSLVRMLANFLSDAVFQNAMLYGMSDGE